MYPEAELMVAYGEFRAPFQKDPNDSRFVFYGMRYIIENFVAVQWTEEDVEQADLFYRTHGAGNTPFPFPKASHAAASCFVAVWGTCFRSVHSLILSFLSLSLVAPRISSSSSCTKTTATSPFVSKLFRKVVSPTSTCLCTKSSHTSSMRAW